MNLKVEYRVGNRAAGSDPCGDGGGGGHGLAVCSGRIKGRRRLRAAQPRRLEQRIENQDKAE